MHNAILIIFDKTSKSELANSQELPVLFTKNFKSAAFRVNEVPIPKHTSIIEYILVNTSIKFC